MSRKVIATSFERYNGGIAIKREYGSSTITKFYVHWEGEESNPQSWKVISGFGKTPGERKSYAIRKFITEQ